MSLKRTSLIAVCLALGLSVQVAPLRAQNLIPENTADLHPFGPAAPGLPGRPHAFGRLFVQLEVVPTCTFDTGSISHSMSIRCTRGVPYRAGIVNDADATFGLTGVFASRPSTGSGELVRIHAQRLNVEF